METLRQSMSWMHTWTGLLFGWILYFMFVTGSAGYYDAELDRWMKPELAAPIEVGENSVALLETALARAAEEVPEASQVSVTLPYDRSFSPQVRVFATGTNAEGDPVRADLQLLEDGSDAPSARETSGGQALYRLHWTFHYIPRALGEFIAGFAAVFMFAAIISGIITHKKIFADFFTLRFSKGQRTWLDSHNVISVMTLPFQIMITFSGILLVVTTFFIPIFVAQYGWNEDTIETISSEMFGVKPPIERSGDLIEPIDLAPLNAEFQTQFPNERLNFIQVSNPGDATSTIRLYGRISDGIVRMSPYVEFTSETGEVLNVKPRTVHDSDGVMNVLEGLHEGLFARPVLRILFFVSGLMGAGMIATGLVLWTKKRRQKLRGDARAERNLVMIERLNVGMIAGLCVGIAAYFYANRLLPVGMEGRADWELHTLFLTWLVFILHSLVRRPEKAWIEQLSATALAFACLPVLNALTTELHLGNTLPLPGRDGNLMMAGVDLWFLVIAAGFAGAARIAARKQADGKPKKPNRTPIPVAAE
ncbi:MAG: PepSY-associated TM helix domain-containing protein [Pseudomonadota bacterium]